MERPLVVFASREEFGILFPNISAVVASSTPVNVDGLFDVVICGVGITEFAVNLSYQLAQKKYKRAFLVGICGVYLNREFSIGDVVRVDTEIVGDFGVQNRDGHFIPWKDISGKEKFYEGASARFLPLSLASLPSAVGVTVNCCTGTSYLSLRRASLFNADIESMEGAPFFAACKRFNVEGYEFRAISNIATDRDTSAWRIPLALENLKKQVLAPENFKS